MSLTWAAVCIAVLYFYVLSVCTIVETSVSSWLAGPEPSPLSTTTACITTTPVSPFLPVTVLWNQNTFLQFRNDLWGQTLKLKRWNVGSKTCTTSRHNVQQVYEHKQKSCQWLFTRLWVQYNVCSICACIGSDDRFKGYRNAETPSRQFSSF